jgi:hypothetical protein
MVAVTAAMMVRIGLLAIGGNLVGIAFAVTGRSRLARIDATNGSMACATDAVTKDSMRAKHAKRESSRIINLLEATISSRDDRKAARTWRERSAFLWKTDGLFAPHPKVPALP